MIISSVAFATTGPKDEDNGSQKDQSKEQVEQTAGSEEITPASTESEGNSDDEGVSISKYSFNFIFYLIYKIKYAEIFKLPTRKKEEASTIGWSQLSVNKIFHNLTRPNP